MQVVKEQSMKVLKRPQKVCQHWRAAQQIRLCVRFLLQLNLSMSCSEKIMVTLKGLLEGRLQGKLKEQVNEQVISFLKLSQSHCVHCIQQSTSVFVFCTISHCPFPPYQVYTLPGSTELSCILFRHKLKRVEVHISGFFLKRFPCYSTYPLFWENPNLTGSKR